ncbi:hypothetical protein MTR67_018430 [Solanum verrucosum]|uniref:Reverse transcriptase domain-containing protein n=1 Tax=Solanum verrucosum TaxID=315347 RepID=A0AAF0TT14_SOLVR|nr:hypothetical protein MTR67_018430 [Solanum verrucosum]
MRYPSEKFNCSRISRSMTDLSEFIEDMELMDLDLAGGRVHMEEREELLTEPAEIQIEITEYYENLYSETEDWRPKLEMRECPMIDEDDNNQLMAPFEAQKILECIKASVQNFSVEGVFEKSINVTFVTLIPKKIGEEELNDFRPISLVGGVYKIIAKLLAERLKKVMHKLVNKQQMAFIKSRQIMDAMLIANKCVDSKKKDKQPGILCKLDIQKAYDHLNGNFLMKMMQRMGFGQRWLKWIRHCISSVKFSILINRNPCEFFPSNRGLRQGDPLSPFLFILAMEGLSNLFHTARANGWIRGFKVGENTRNNLEITHLQYADDTLVFCGAVKEHMLILRVILNIFEAVSGGRLTLVNSVLDALPSYMMSIFPIPTKVTKRLDAIRMNFLWKDSEDKKKYHLVKWEELLVSNRGGGLNIRDLRTYGYWSKIEQNVRLEMEKKWPSGMTSGVRCGQETLKQAFLELHNLSQA